MKKEVARKDLGKKIRELRKIKGLTQEELGEKARLSYKFIGELERGNVNVSLDSLTSIAQGLDIEVGDLFGKKKSVVRVTEKSPLSKLSSREVQTINKALKLLNKVFSKR